MSLPKINTPEYKLNIPSTDEEITYRPFLVKEEKILLVAQETGGEKEQYLAIQNLIKGCVSEKLEVDKLPMFDLEYIFLNIRAKSVGEIAKLKVICPDDEKTTVDVEVDLTKINIEMDEEHNPRIEITVKVGLLMSYPTMDLIGELSLYGDVDAKDSANKMFELIADCMYQIWEGEEIHDCTDYTSKEKIDFLESLNHSQFEKIQKFFDSMPTLKKDVEVTNPHTNVTSTVTLRGITSFFG